MKTKLLLAVAIVAALSGCATASGEGVFMTTPRARMSIADLNAFKLDCDQAEEQFEFLNYHLSSRKERIANGLMLTSIFGWVNVYRDGSWPDAWALREGRYDNTARILIAQLAERCQEGMPTVKKKSQGCVSLEESMTAGASSGSQCVQKDQKKITRWEALIDN